MALYFFILDRSQPPYANREGVVTHIDDAGQIHGTWGGCAMVLSLSPTVET